MLVKSRPVGFIGGSGTVINFFSVRAGFPAAHKTGAALFLVAALGLSGCVESEQQVSKDCDACPELVAVPQGDLWVDALEVADIPLGGDVPAGDFRRVGIHSFLLGRTEVTRGQWRALMGETGKAPSGYGDDYPITNVSWMDAQEYARRLSQKTGKAYRLPTEAEWVYAARAGSPDGSHFDYSVHQIGSLAWHTGNREFSWVIDCQNPFQCGSVNSPRLSAVAKKQPNAFGLYDMYGNAEEWVEDVYHRSFIKWSAERADLPGSCDPLVRMLRGGSVLQDPLALINRRAGVPRDTQSPFGGFRVARSLPMTPPPAPATAAESACQSKSVPSITRTEKAVRRGDHGRLHRRAKKRVPNSRGR